MKRNLFIIFLLCLLTSGLCSPVEAKEDIEIFPEVICPGDVFAVRINTDRIYESVAGMFQGSKVYFSRCGKGCFIGIFPVDISIEPGRYEIQIRSGKTKIIREIDVRDKEFDVQRLILPEEKVLLSKKDLRRVKKENDLIKKVFKVRTKKKWIGDFIYPVENDITTEFGTRRIMNGYFESVHRGLDIKGEMGEEVMASNRGRVTLIKELFFGGKSIIIDHGEGIFTIYMHLSKVLVKKDSIVSKGDIIGYVGSTGRSTAPHLHFGINIRGKNINPVSMILLDL